MKKVRIIMVLAICLIFGANAYAYGGRHNNYNNDAQSYNHGDYSDKQYRYHHEDVKVKKHARAKQKSRHHVVQETVVAHHHE